MNDIEFNSVSKKYRIRREKEIGDTNLSIRARLLQLRQRSQEFWALRDLSFAVKRGESLGIIGHNGAGKSTILKLLSNITAPTSGEIRIRGRLSALIEVGSGFHPDLTGRENIYLSGSILGMRRREITEKLDSIIDFAGVREFIDTPVKRYSSGMYVRLGFSIAAHLHPDILLLDEVLAVGDAVFQAKCFKRISELKQAGITIVFISHDLAAVELLCDRVLLISSGRMVAEGPAREMTALYQQSCGADSLWPKSIATDEPPRAAEITALSLESYEVQSAEVFHTGLPLSARVEYRVHEPVSDVVFEIFFYSADGRYHCQYTTAFGGEPIYLEEGAGAVEFLCEELGLQPGIYYVDASIRRRSASEDIDWLQRGATIRVDPFKTVSGRFYMPHHWCVLKSGNAVDAMPAEKKASQRQIMQKCINGEGSSEFNQHRAVSGGLVNK